MNKSILSMKDIRKTFSGVAVLDEVELNLNEGECLGLLGSNGAGKSTLIKILSGIYSKDKGTISILNKEVNIKNSSDSIKEGVGLLPQELSIHSEMNVAENLMMGNLPVKKIIDVSPDNKCVICVICMSNKIDKTPISLCGHIGYCINCKKT